MTEDEIAQRLRDIEAHEWGGAPPSMGSGDELHDAWLAGVDQFLADHEEFTVFHTEDGLAMAQIPVSMMQSLLGAVAYGIDMSNMINGLDGESGPVVFEANALTPHHVQQISIFGGIISRLFEQFGYGCIRDDG